MVDKRSKYSPNALAKQAFRLAPLPFVNSPGQVASLMCKEKIFFAGLSHEASYIENPCDFNWVCIESMDSSKHASLPLIKVNSLIHSIPSN